MNFWLFNQKKRLTISRIAQSQQKSLRIPRIERWSWITVDSEPLLANDRKCVGGFSLYWLGFVVDFSTWVPLDSGDDVRLWPGEFQHALEAGHLNWRRAIAIPAKKTTTRFTKGVARYDSNFTAPTVDFASPVTSQKSFDEQTLAASLALETHAGRLAETALASDIASLAQKSAFGARIPEVGSLLTVVEIDPYNSDKKVTGRDLLVRVVAIRETRVNTLAQTVTATLQVEPVKTREAIFHRLVWRNWPFVSL